MIRFISRIRKKLLDGGDIRKYLLYAVGETLLVTFGILLALQVNNWNERQKANKEELKVLKTLSVEFKDNIQTLESVFESHHRTINSIENAINKYDLLNGVDVDDLAIKELREAMQGKSYDPKFGVLNSLLNSEKINLIKNDSLRNLIATVPGILNDYTEDEKLVIKSYYELYLPEILKLNQGDKDLVNPVIHNYLAYMLPFMESILSEGAEMKADLNEILSLINSQIE